LEWDINFLQTIYTRTSRHQTVRDVTRRDD
jgi:hypothetical protein